MTLTEITPATSDKLQFEMECIDLLSRLENKLSVLRESSNGGPDFKCIDVAKEILAEFADFVASQRELAESRSRIISLFERTKDVERLLLRKSWKALNPFAGKSVTAESALSISFAELKSAYVELFSDVLNDCASQFERESAIEQLLTTGRSLVTDLTSRW